MVQAMTGGRRYWLPFVGMLALMSSAVLAHAQLPLEVEIGTYSTLSSFDIRGYGVLVRYRGECLVIAPAHVARTSEADTEYSDVTVRSDEETAASPESIDYIEDGDIYVGRILPSGKMFEQCSSTAELEDLYKAYRVTLRNLLDADFRGLEIHNTPDAIKVLPQDAATLQAALRGEPLRYRLDACAGSSCPAPVQKSSGSIVSMPAGAEDRLLLGLHQGGCEKKCQGDYPLWQAISVISIYNFIKRPSFPLTTSEEPDPDRQRLEYAAALAAEAARTAGIRSEPFKVVDRNTDVVGIMIGQSYSELIQLFLPHKEYFIEKIEKQDNTSGGKTLIFYKESEETKERIVVDIATNSLVSRVKRIITFNTGHLPSIDGWAEPIHKKYGPYSYVKNGPGYTNIYWDYFHGGQMEEERRDVDHRILCTLSYDGGLVYSVTVDLIELQPSKVAAPSTAKQTY
jgi:hypothetical protein